jgi:hypothetical protein
MDVKKKKKESNVLALSDNQYAIIYARISNLATTVCAPSTDQSCFVSGSFLAILTRRDEMTNSYLTVYILLKHLEGITVPPQ